MATLPTAHAEGVYMSYAQGGKREGVAAQGNAVGPAEGKQIEQRRQAQGALTNGDGLARQLRQA